MEVGKESRWEVPHLARSEKSCGQGLSIGRSREQTASVLKYIHRGFRVHPRAAILHLIQAAWCSKREHALLPVRQLHADNQNVSSLSCPLNSQPRSPPGLPCIHTICNILWIAYILINAFRTLPQIPTSLERETNNLQKEAKNYLDAMRCEFCYYNSR